MKRNRTISWVLTVPKALHRGNPMAGQGAQNARPDDSPHPWSEPFGTLSRAAWSLQEAILCVKGLKFFHLMVKYRSHTDQTIGYIERNFEDFHCHKEVFTRFRAKKSTKQSSSVLRYELFEELRTEHEESSDWNRL